MSGTVTAPGNQLHLKLFILCYKNVFYLQNQHIHTLHTVLTCRRDRNCNTVHAVCANVCYVNKTQPIIEF